jgi:hypothetical protein
MRAHPATMDASPLAYSCMPPMLGHGGTEMAEVHASGANTWVRCQLACEPNPAISASLVASSCMPPMMGPGGTDMAWGQSFGATVGSFHAMRMHASTNAPFAPPPPQFAR